MDVGCEDGPRTAHGKQVTDASYTRADLIVISRRHAEHAVERMRWWLFGQGFAAGAGCVAAVYWWLGR